MIEIQTVVFRKKLSKGLHEFSLEHDRENISPAHNIRSYMVVLWNYFKSGQDVVSQILKNVKIDFKFCF